MDSKSVDTDMENVTPETNYFKMMMEDNQLGRVPFSTNDNADTDSIIGGQTIASLMHDGNNGRNNNHGRAGDSAAMDSESNTTSESYNQQLNDADAEATNNSTMSIVGYGDDVSTIANDTVNETTTAFFTGNGDRKDSKPRIRLFKEYKTKDKESKKNSNSDFKTPEKKKSSSTNPFDNDEETQPETPPEMINVPSLSNRSTSSHKKKFGDDVYLMNGGKKKITKNAKRVYVIAGVLALILFVSIISLGVALRGVREPDESTSLSAINSENTRNEIQDLWPDLDVPVDKNDFNDDVNNANDNEIPSMTEPTDEEPIDEEPINEEPTGNEPINEETIDEEKPVVATTPPTEDPTLRPTAEPTLRPTAKPTLRPTAKPTLRPTAEPTLRPTTSTPQMKFDTALTLLVGRGAVSDEKDIEQNPESPQFYATTWLSQDPNYIQYAEDEERLVQRWTLAVLALSLDATAVVDLQDGVVESDTRLPQGWLTYTDECTWFTSSTNSNASPCNNDGNYQSIDLADQMLGGTLPTELALLSNLKHLVLDGNELMGSIPQELEELNKLKTLRLRRNNLENNLSIDFGELDKLRILDLGENNLTGDLPYNIVDMKAPTEIYLDYNNLDGNIPWAIGNLDTLTALALGDNKFTGWIPDTIGNMENLEILTLENNQLTGVLPNAICLLESMEVLSADCAEQGCTCCTKCSATDFPSESPKTPTDNPTTPPTKTPTAGLTNSPTLAPVPMNSPTECVTEITVLDICFAPSANIGITLSNCDSERDDWVGVYRVDDSFDFNDMGNSAMWSWTCGTRNCQEAVTQKNIQLNDVHAENNDWPLEPGIYVAILGRNTAQPYTSYAASETFVVATQC